jgi:hypothetical protein
METSFQTVVPLGFSTDAECLPDSEELFPVLIFAFYVLFQGPNLWILYLDILTVTSVHVMSFGVQYCGRKDQCPEDTWAAEGISAHTISSWGESPW